MLCICLGWRRRFFEDGILDLCAERGIGVVIGGPQNSGLLAKPDHTVPYSHGFPAPPEQLERAERLHGICARHGVSLMAAALQFPLGHPATTSATPASPSTSLPSPPPGLRYGTTGSQ